MKLLVVITLLTSGLVGTAVARADEASRQTMVDVLTDADPRSRFDSGLGIAVGEYVDELQEPAAEGSLDPSQIPSLRRPSLDFDSVSASERDERAAPLDLTPDADRWPGDVRPLPLGRPDRREGVWYEDDLSVTTTP